MSRSLVIEVVVLIGWIRIIQFAVSSYRQRKPKRKEEGDKDVPTS